MSTSENQRRTGLQRHSPNLHRGLSADAYFDPRHLRAGTAEDLVPQLDLCRPLERGFGGASVPHLRDRRPENAAGARRAGGALQGFHNTCRHRGAALCRERRERCAPARSSAPIMRGPTTCKANLMRTSSQAHGAGFDVADFPLYKIKVREWNGFIFVAMTENPPAFAAPVRCAARTGSTLGGWASSSVGQYLVKTIQCNWKIFWENFNECLHCPGVHPQALQPGADLRPRHAGGARRSALDAPCGGFGSEIQGRCALGRPYLVDRTGS